MALFAALVFLTPMIFAGVTAEMYEFPKMIFVYVLGTTIVFVWSVRCILWGENKLRLPGWEITGLTIITILSVVFSSHLYTSVWGYYSRFNGGLVSWLVFLGIYMVGTNFLDEKKTNQLKDILCLALFPVSLYGIFQVFEYDRIFSTLGQPNWLAAYIVFLVPLLLDRIISTEDILKRNFWAATFLFSFVSLWFTSSLSGLAGLAAGLVYLGFKFKQRAFNKWGLILVLLVLMFTAVNLDFLKARLSDAFVLSTDPESYQVSDPGLIRLGLWTGSLRMSTSSPKNFLLGTGPETFPYEFPFFRAGFLNYSSEWDFILNKPHNYYLEILAESGILALIFYLALMIRTLKTKDTFLKAGLIGFYVTNIFSWPTVVTSLVFWIFLIFIEKKKDLSIGSSKGGTN